MCRIEAYDMFMAFIALHVLGPKGDVENDMLIKGSIDRGATYNDAQTKRLCMRSGTVGRADKDLSLAAAFFVADNSTSTFKRAEAVHSFGWVSLFYHDTDETTQCGVPGVSLQAARWASGNLQTSMAASDSIIECCSSGSTPRNCRATCSHIYSFAPTGTQTEAETFCKTRPAARKAADEKGGRCLGRVQECC